MYELIVVSIICNTFDKCVGRHQDNPFSRDPKAKKMAMDIRFDLQVDYEKEKGYRHLTVRIYAPGNYVAVLVKEDWNVIANEDLVWSDREQYAVIRKGSKGYVKGETEWELVSYHDSCWRSDGVDNILWKNRERITHIDTLGSTEGWYNKVEMTAEEIRKFGEAEKRRNI